MKLFRVTNGVGDHCFSIAPTEAIALSVARELFKSEGIRGRVAAEEVCADTSKIWVSEMLSYEARGQS